MRITAGGSVGIGTTSPAYKLDVSGDIHTNSEVYLDNNAYLRFKRTSGGLSIQTLGIPSGTDDVRLLTTGDFNVLNGSLVNLMAVKNGGNVGIGTTGPIGKLQIGGTSGNLLTVGTLTNNWGGDVAIGITNGNGVILSKINTANDTNRVLVLSRDDTNGATIVGYTPTGGSTDIGFLIRANSTSYFNGGNVGISTTTPSYRLHVDANTSALFRVSNGAPLTYFQSSYYGYASSYEVAQIGDWYGKSSSGVAVAIGIDPKLITGGSFFGNEIALPDFTEFITANAPSGSATDWNQNVLVISGSNIGIGTATPLSKLHVNGDIRASLANVSQANLVAYNTSTGLFTYLSTSSFATTNIYNADGTLTGNRTVSLDTNNLTFVAEEADFIIQSGQEASVNITNLPQENRPHQLFYDSGTGQLLFDETSSISSYQEVQTDKSNTTTEVYLEVLLIILQ
jgi:hypothetical protein